MFQHNQTDSMFVGVKKDGVVLSFKHPDGLPVKVVFQERPTKLFGALDALKADRDYVHQHGFDHREFDANDLTFGGWLRRSEHSKERLTLHVSFYVGQGSSEFHEYEVTLDIKQLEYVLGAINKFFED